MRSEQSRGQNGAGAIESHGYHPGNFDSPQTRRGRFEIVVGAVLTQNTAWRNVEQALSALHRARVVTPEATLRQSRASLAELIRPAGYFNQKSDYLLAVADWFRTSDRQLCLGPKTTEKLNRARPKLLAVRGIGPETADSILLYGYRLPSFVIDAYTRRIFERLGALAGGERYETLRATFQTALMQASDELCCRYWQEAHAVIVEHAKRHYGRLQRGESDPLICSAS